MYRYDTQPWPFAKAGVFILVSACLPGVLLGGIYEKMAKFGLRYFLKVITVLETL
jgi:hypothetical protein